VRTDYTFLFYICENYPFQDLFVPDQTPKLTGWFDHITVLDSPTSTFTKHFRLPKTSDVCMYVCVRVSNRIIVCFYCFPSSWKVLKRH